MFIAALLISNVAMMHCRHPLQVFSARTMSCKAALQGSVD